MQNNKWDIPDNAIFLHFLAFQKAASSGKIYTSQMANQYKQTYRKLHTAIGSFDRDNQIKINGQ